MKNDKTCAKKCYEDFQSMRRSFQCPDDIEEGSALSRIVLNFEEFERIVENLKKEIKHAHESKTK
jgi:hypothetical protein